MINNQKISPRQAFFLMTMTCIGTGLITYSEVVKLAGGGAGIADLTSVLFIIPLALWILRLGHYAPGHTILEILEMTTGKIIGRVVCGVYALVSIAVMTLSTRYLCSLLQLFTLPNTPLWVTTFAFITLTTAIAKGGIEVQGRLSEIIFFVLHIVYFSGTGPAFLYINPDFLFPIFDRGVAAVAAGSYLQAGTLSEAVLFLLIMVAALPNLKDSYLVISLGLLVESVLYMIASTLLIGVYSVEVASHLTMVTIQLGFDVQQGKFIQGLEVFVQVAQILGLIISVGVHTYAASVATTQIFNNRYPMVWLGMISVAVAITVNCIPSFNEAIFFSTLLGRYVTIPFIILVLLMTSAGLLLRRRKVNGHRQ